MTESTGKLSGALRVECAEWVWEQLQEDGYFLSGELVDLVLDVERQLAIQGEDVKSIAQKLEAEFTSRGIEGAPGTINAQLIGQVLSWEDEFLSLAAIPRSES